jgi:Beta-lactamase
MERQHIPGMSVAVLISDSVMMAQGYGWANLELGVPASDSTIYQSGSVQSLRVRKVPHSRPAVFVDSRRRRGARSWGRI